MNYWPPRNYRAISSSVARSSGRAADASISSVTQDRVVGKGFDSTTRTNECTTTANVVVDLVLGNLYDRCAGITSITRPDTIARIVADLAVPNAGDSYSASSQGVYENTVDGVTDQSRAVNSAQ